MRSVNLLPRKEKKNQLPLFAILLLIVGASLIFPTYYWYGTSVQEETTGIVKQNESIQKKMAKDKQEIEIAGDRSELEFLNKISRQLKAQEPLTVDLIDNLTGLLPEEGYMSKFQFTRESSTILLTLHFETYLESGYYLTSLLESDWVKSAKLTNITSNGTNNKLDFSGSYYVAQYVIVIDETQWNAKEEGEDTP